jgi:acetate kinase
MTKVSSILGIDIDVFRHNASALAIIKSCVKELPDARNIAIFDSAFHHTMPEAVKTYAIDQKLAKAKGLRKYGFHGISYSYIQRRVSKFLGKAPSSINLIVMHLGAGSSVCAIRQGQSIDTSYVRSPWEMWSIRKKLTT